MKHGEYKHVKRARNKQQSVRSDRRGRRGMRLWQVREAQVGCPKGQPKLALRALVINIGLS